MKIFLTILEMNYDISTNLMQFGGHTSVQTWHKVQDHVSIV